MLGQQLHRTHKMRSEKEIRNELNYLKKVTKDNRFSFGNRDCSDYIVSWIEGLEWVLGERETREQDET